MDRKLNWRPLDSRGPAGSSIHDPAQNPTVQLEHRQYAWCSPAMRRDPILGTVLANYAPVAAAWPTPDPTARDAALRATFFSAASAAGAAAV